ncbi:MAG: inositol monophosphatase family protein [Janthinobacterium lividum]
MPDGGLAAPAGDFDLLVRATRAAGALAMKYFDAGDVRAWDKSPGNPVSEADLAVDACLRDELLDRRPGYGWLSEETADDPSRLDCRYVWVVDPIDGTRDFLRGRTGWAVSVALIDDGEAVLGCLAAPARGQLFVASRGGGAYRDGVRIGVSGRTALAGCAMPIDLAGLTAGFWPEPWDAVPVEKPNSLALRIAKVASGEADAFIEGRTISEWDVAAAALILAEAGGIVTDRDGAALSFNQPDPAVHGLAAATPALHAEVRRRLDAGLHALKARRSGREG